VLHHQILGRCIIESPVWFAFWQRETRIIEIVGVEETVDALGEDDR